MIFVIQCAAAKHRDAGRFVTHDGRLVEFVAHPAVAPRDESRLFARPDDPAFYGKSWRQLLVDYNTTPDKNPLGLHPAYRLYKNSAYVRLVERFGISDVFILSAGWGLIRANFLTPYYDITFSKGTKLPEFKRRRKLDSYDDFCMIPDGRQEEIVFFGGMDYLPQFYNLTAGIRSKKTVFYNSIVGPRFDNCTLRRFNTSKRTNWHYQCVDGVLGGMITI